MTESVRIDTADVAAVTAPLPAPATPAAASQPSVFHHAVYVIGENPVTGLAFGLFLLIVVCAIFGSLVAPYDPLASNTDAAYQAPSVAHWFGTDQFGRDIMSRVVVATRSRATSAPEGRARRSTSRGTARR